MGRLVLLGCLAYVVVGFGHLAIGSVMEPMVRAYGISYAEGGQLIMNQFLGVMFGMMVAPWLIRRFGKKTLLFAALGTMVVAEAIFVAQPPWEWMLVVGPFAGFGFGTTEAVVGAFIIGSAAGNANVAMTRVETFFGIGALVMPFVGSLLISEGLWKLTFGFVSLLTLATLVLWILFWPDILDREGGYAADEAAAKEPGVTKRRATLILGVCAVFFVLYVGLEMSFTHYLPSVLVQNNGLSESHASLSLAVFWAAITIGRLFTGHIADRIGEGSYLFAACVASAAVFALMGAADHATALFVLVFLAGLAMSGMFAVALVFANRAVPGITDRATSLLMAFGGLGGALVPKLTGQVLDEQGPDATRWLYAVFAIALVFVIAGAVRAAKGSPQGRIDAKKA
ncbi:MFS transporter [Paenibacillaceae bacterium WGS1546]|uniref:MFS transporter n=1 Tax=Cohnella sp. WGS1546 TaxID=3366810 RepID=UPI00372D3F4A